MVNIESYMGDLFIMVNIESYMGDLWPYQDYQLIVVQKVSSFY